MMADKKVYVGKPKGTKGYVKSRAERIKEGYESGDALSNFFKNLFSSDEEDSEPTLEDCESCPNCEGCEKYEELKAKEKASNDAGVSEALKKLIKKTRGE